MDSDSHRVRRLEVVNTGRRRRFSLAEKLRIVEESLSGDRQASATARRHAIPNSLLFKWRRAYREGRLGCGAGAPGFVPAVVVSDGGTAPALRDGGGRMEIVARGGQIVGAEVDAAALARVLAVLEGR